MLVGLLTAFVPEIAYVLVYLFSFSHAFSTLILGGVTFTELCIALYVIRRT